MSVVRNTEAIEGHEELVAAPTIRRENLLPWLKLVLLMRGDTEVAVRVIVCPPAEVWWRVSLGFLQNGRFLVSIGDDTTFDVAHLSDKLALNFRDLQVFTLLVYNRSRIVCSRSSLVIFRILILFIIVVVLFFLIVILLLLLPLLFLFVFP